MLTGLYSAASGLDVAERLHELISDNLAHAEMPGYRGQTLSLHTFEEAMKGKLPTPSPEGHGVWTGGVATDFTNGPLQHTQRSLDLAISGNGFFEITTPDGPRYTRNGVFYLDNDSQIVNSEGYPLAGKSGPLQIPPGTTTEDISITTDGTVNVSGQTIGQLKLVEFGDNQQLERAGTTLFLAPPGVTPLDSNSTVLQGTRELSNISTVNEMVRLIVGTRHYEATQKALTTLDEAIGKRTNPQG